MNEEEKKLLDYLYTVGQQVQDYMRRNGFCKKNYQSGEIRIYVDPDSHKYDYITASFCTKEQGEPLRIAKRTYDIVKHKSEYTVKEVQ